MSHPPSKNLSRRAVARGAAWAVPAIVMTTAPAFADSGPCPPLNASWSITNQTNIANVDQTTNNPSPGAITFVSDATPGSRGSVTFSTPLTVQAGRSYTFTFDLQTRYGYSQDWSVKFNTSVDITLAQAGKTSTIFSGSTQAGNTGTVVTPPTAWNTWGADGKDNAHKTVSHTYTPTASGTATLAYAFTLNAPTETNNDDWKIVPTLVCNTA